MMIAMSCRSASCTGGRSGIFAGELVNIYKKYADGEGWRVSTMEEQDADMVCPDLYTPITVICTASSV